MWQLLAFTSAIFSALAAVFEKKALIKTNPLEFSLVLSAITLVFSLPFLFLVNFQNIELFTLLILYGKSVLGAFAFLLVMNGLKKLELSSSLPLLVLTPGIVAIFAFLILGEKLSAKDFSGMLLLLIGTYVLQIKPDKGLLFPFQVAKQNRAYLYLVGAILLFTSTTILDKSILRDYKLQPEAFIPIQQMFFTINFLIIYLIRHKTIKFQKNISSDSWKIIVAVALFAVIYRYSHILAIKAGSVALVLSIKRTSVFFATVFGGQYFKEQHVLRKSIATFIMIGGAVFIIL